MVDADYEIALWRNENVATWNVSWQTERLLITVEATAQHLLFISSH